MSKKKERTKKILKIVLITLLCIVIAISGAIVIVYNFVIKPNGEKIAQVVDELIQDEEIIKKIEPYLKKEDMDRILENVDDDVKEKLKNTEGENVLGEGSESAVNTPTKPAQGDSTQPKKPRSAYKSQADYVKDNVPDDDYNLGMGFVSRVDLGYVLGLLSGGLTPQEKKELKDYLTARFSAEEIAQGIALYSKYSYLLK